jgi:hypothetical protein
LAIVLICSSCGCHLREREGRCPHCRADLGAPGALRRPERRYADVRRVVFATALGLGAIGCNGRIANTDVAGTCGASQLDSLSSCAAGYCQCGTGGTCSDAGCVSCDCDQSEKCGTDGKCHASDPTSSEQTHWFDGKLPNSGACYGAPPILVA